MSKLDLHVLDHYRYWQVKLLIVVGLTVALSLAKHIWDWPSDDDDWYWLEWVSHAATAMLVIIVIFFRIDITEVRSLYHSAVGLNQILYGLQNEDTELRNRLMLPLLEKMAKEPDEYGTLLMNIKDPSVLQMISDMCSQITDGLLLKLADRASTAANDVKIHYKSPAVNAIKEKMKQFEKIQEYCNKSTP